MHIKGRDISYKSKVMNFKYHLDELKKLNLPEDEFVVVSSGALAVRRIREAKDLDVIVTEKLWNKLIQKYQVILQGDVERIQFDADIEILNPKQSLFGNSEIVPIDEMFEQADVFDGIRFINLDHLRKIKLSMGREKDLKDIELMDAYISNTSH